MTAPQDYPKNIYSFNGLYTVTRKGVIDIDPTRTPPLPEFYVNKQGERCVTLHRPSPRGKYRRVRLLIKNVVADAFVENPQPFKLRKVRVINGDESDLNADNLEWVPSRSAREQHTADKCPKSKPKSPTGWTAHTRILPDGSVFKRNRLSRAVCQYKCIPHGEGVKAGKLLRIYPSISVASQLTACSTGGLKQCCDFWLLFDGMGTTSVEIKGYGKCVNPEDLPARPLVACTRQGRQFVFKYSGLADPRKHPVAIVFDHLDDPSWPDSTTEFYQSVADAAKCLRTPYETSAQLAASLSSAAARSPMYPVTSPPTITTPDAWPTVLTVRGRAWVFYI